MSTWGRVFAAYYDRVMAGTERATLQAHRRTLIGQAAGRVLEIGGGTGANLPFYGTGVQTLALTEPETPMMRRLQRKLHEHSHDARVHRAPAEELPFEDASFDVAVSTLVLCTVEDQRRALGELRRVLAPGGRLLFIEHVRSEETRIARWQDRLNPLQQRIGHGCNCNRATLHAIRDAGFSIAEVRHDVLRKAPPILRPLVVGVATPTNESSIQPAD